MSLLPNSDELQILHSCGTLVTVRIEGTFAGPMAMPEKCPKCGKPVQDERISDALIAYASKHIH